MGKFEVYLDRAKDLAEDAGDAAKRFADDVRTRAKELAEEDSKVKELAKSAREQSTALSLGAKEKVQGVVQGVMQDAKAGKELRAGIAELENLPEFEGSIIYNMELEAMINDLRKLMLFIEDNRLDDASVIEEVGKVMAKVQPVAVSASEEAPELSDEDKAIENAKTIAYRACTRALAVLNASAQQV